jgi:transcriptional regulator with XRE-family HTH domain
MGLNVYPWQTSVASEKFAIGETTRVPPAIILGDMTKAGAGRRYFIAEWARAKGKRQRDVIRETKLSKAYVSLLWSGTKDDPSADVVDSIAACFGIPAYALMINPLLAEARVLDALAQLPAGQRAAIVEMIEAAARGRK